ncbi:MAG: PDR/VanB family oxidoreductase [Mycobacterium sp.]
MSRLRRKAQPTTKSKRPPLPPTLYGTLPVSPVIAVVTALFPLAVRAIGALLILKKPPENHVDRTLKLVIADRWVEATDDNVVSLVLASPNGERLPPWHPGAHLDLLLPSGRMRQYSLCGDLTDPFRYRIAVRRIPDGGGSVEVHDGLQVGAQISILGPRNAFPLAMTQPGPRKLHFVAGGIGITPILSMINFAEQLGKPWTMVYTGRHRDSMPFLNELKRFGDRVLVRTDTESGLPTADDLLPEVGENDAVYCCGPAPMLGVLQRRLLEMPSVELHFERFAAAPVVDGHPFEVQLGPGGPVLAVPADRTALAVIKEHLPHVAYSCQQGFCGTCKVNVLAGTVDHRDQILTESQREEGQLLTCISRGEGRLVLDLPAS